MTELDLLRSFFLAWESLHAIPKGKGRPSLEQEAAAQLLVDRAHAVKTFAAPEKANESFVPSEARIMLAQTNDIQPRNGWGNGN